MCFERSRQQGACKQYNLFAQDMVQRTVKTDTFVVSFGQAHSLLFLGQHWGVSRGRPLDGWGRQHGTNKSRKEASTHRKDAWGVKQCCIEDTKWPPQGVEGGQRKSTCRMTHCNILQVHVHNVMVQSHEHALMSEPVNGCPIDHMLERQDERQ